jgi:hypothetical protein
MSAAHPIHVNKLIFGVGLYGPMVVAGGMTVVGIILAMLANHGSSEEVDELAGRPHAWTFTVLCAGALAVADPIVGAIGYRAPLVILARTALGGAMAGVILGRALAIGNGAVMILVDRLWPVAILIGGAIHIGALWSVLG